MRMLIYLDGESYHHPPVLMGKLIARAAHGEIRVLIGVAPDGHQENGESIADQVRSDLQGLSPQVDIRQGQPGQIICEELQRETYQLVIVNADRITRAKRKVEVDPVLIKQSTISLLLTRNPKPKIKHILLCSACIEGDYSLINQTAGLARDLGAAVTMLHVISGSVPSMYTGLDQIEETVEEILQTDTSFAQHLRHGVGIFREQNIEAEVKIRWGIPIEEIVRETQLVDYDLVVIGSSRFNQGLLEMLLGNMMNKIIDQIELPVLIVGSRDLTESP
jgi:nucleotide-binding universal stress UspA family protein